MKVSLINKLNKLKNSFFIKEDLNKNFKNIYIKIAELIFLKKTFLRKPLIIGLAGGQGSGKTTFAQFLKLILENRYNLRTVTVSIDDIYKTKKERIKISKKINKLFLIRGVPGTHDVNFLTKFFTALKNNSFNKYFLININKTLDELEYANSINMLSNCLNDNKYIYKDRDQRINRKLLDKYVKYIDKEYFVAGTIFFCSAKIFDKVIELYHGHKKTDKHQAETPSVTLNAPDFPPDEAAMIKSTRIRVGRNLADFPLGPGLTRE